MRAYFTLYYAWYGRKSFVCKILDFLHLSVQLLTQNGLKSSLHFVFLFLYIHFLTYTLELGERKTCFWIIGLCEKIVK